MAVNCCVFLFFVNFSVLFLRTMFYRNEIACVDKLHKFWVMKEESALRPVILSLILFSMCLQPFYRYTS